MLEPKQRLGDFEIIRRIGRGGMGEVYEALQLHPPRPVALKTLVPWLSDDDRALQRFWREAEVPARLDHPGIVRIISTGKTDDGTAFYTMQLVRGISLAGLLKASKETLASTVLPPQPPAGGNAAPDWSPAGTPIQAGESPPKILEAYRNDRFRLVARLGLQAARALAYAHEQGFLHRDIKSSNIMVDHHDQVYLVDFGLTRPVMSGATGTQAGSLVGTPWYMSPEQARGEEADKRSDIYSLGVTLYELATGGSGPFTAARENTEAVLTQVRAGAHLPLRLLAPTIPAKLEKIIVRAMQTKRQRRHANAKELADDLEQFLDSPSTSSATPRYLTKIKHGLFASRLKRWLPLLLLPVLGAIAWLALHHSFDDTDIGKPEKPGNGKAAVRSAISWPSDYPEILRERQVGKTIALFHLQKEDPLAKDPLQGTADLQPAPPPERDFRMRPRWRTRLYGSGKYYPYPDMVMVNSAPQGAIGVTLLALDDDLEHRPFAFSCKIQRLNPNRHLQNARGVFFGWQRTNKEDAQAYFVHLDDFSLEKKGWEHGQWAVGKSLLKGANLVAPLSPVRANENQTYPLQRVAIWHTISVHARKDKVIVWVDDSPACDFLPPFPPWGPLGVWVQQGMGHFKDATIGALAADQ